MSFVLTFVSSQDDHALAPTHIKQAIYIIKQYDISPTVETVWLADGKAADLGIDEKPQTACLTQLRDEFASDKIDIFINPIEGRQKKLLLADMDSTMVSSETLDELADYAGLKEEIAVITQKAMEGDLDFHNALRQRVGLLKGLPASKLQETLEQTEINPGAASLVQTMRKNGATCVLVSGGFTFFTHAIAQELGFHNDHGNTLDIEDEILTGKVIEPIQDKFSKLEYLRQYCEDLGLKEEAVMTIGDGANDIPMLKAAGFGVGYHPKPLVADAVHNCILYGDLSAALYAQGYRQDQIVLS